MHEKVRLDVYLHEQGFAPSREKARAWIMAGLVSMNGMRADKPAVSVLENDIVEVKTQEKLFVSRGGAKLKKAFEVFHLDVNNAVCADIGASTGGFTDCLIQNGARKVYAIDVGYGQLDWKLRCDERVIVLERTNARNMQPDWFAEPINFVCMDVSFISIQLILRPLFDCLNEKGQAVVLIKPQFEAGRGQVGKKGVIRDPNIHTQVIIDTLIFARRNGYRIYGLDYSPITGPQGNIEFLLYVRKEDAVDLWPVEEDLMHAQLVVTAAHQAFKS